MDALCGEPERRSEAQPGLYGHDEQVDQIRKLVVDLLQPKPAAAPDEGMRKHPASGDRDKRAQHESGDAVAGGAPEPDQEQRQEQRRKRLIPQKLVRRHPVQACAQEILPKRGEADRPGMLGDEAAR